MRAMLAGFLILFMTGCDIAQHDRLEHEYRMACLDKHGNMNWWTQLCELPNRYMVLK